MIQQPHFYKRFVVRNEGQFRQPPLAKLERFELPPLALVHHIPQSLTNIWPNDSWYMYQQNDKPIRISHIMDLVEPVGGAKLRTGDWNSRIREFRNRNPRFRAALELDEMKTSPRQIVTFNYGILFERWKYQRSAFSNINRWTNIFNTFFSKAGETVSSGYNQYIEVLMPKQLPKRDLLEKTELGWTPRNMVAFNSYPMFMLHHLWVWLGENRHKGLIARNFKNGYKGVYLVFRDGDRFTVLDMERINSWRNPSKHEQNLHKEMRRANPEVELPPLPNGKFAPQMMQKILLRMCMSLMSCRAADVPENLGDEEVVDKAIDKQLDEVVNGSPTTDSESMPASATSDDEVTEETAFAGYNEEVDVANLMAEVDKDIEALDAVGTDGSDENAESSFEESDDIGIPDEDEIAQSQQSDEQADGEAKFFPEDPVEAFKAMCNRAATEGSISANDYRKLMELSEASKQLPAPLGAQGSLVEFTKVTAEDTKIDPDDPEIAIPDSNTVIDKSMLKSTLQVMDRRYADKVLQKDVAAMVMQLQAAGLAIRSYDVQEVEDITGAHFEYTVQVKPVEGAASTLRFKLPKVEEDGNFKINGVPYRLRKQRGD